MDDLISEMLAAGFDTDDLKHLERLSDPAILRMIPGPKGNISHNVKDDVILYMNTWADMIADELVKSVQLPKLETPSLATTPL